MAAVAAELQRAGMTISGSDTSYYPPMSEFLREQSVRTQQGYDPKNIPPNSLIVVGNSVSRGNPELEYALNERLPLISLPELIANRYLSQRQSIVVVGTHGKTTTTTMLAHILCEDDRDPGWMIGGIPADLPVPCEFGSGKEFVIEGDEYDAVYWDKRPKFLLYKPHHAIINSVEFDHADIYRDLSEIELQFQRFVELLPENGIIVAYGDNSLVREICAAALCKVITIRAGANSDWQIDFDIFVEENKAEITDPDSKTWLLSIGMQGKHNLMNGLAAIVMAVSLGVKLESALKSLKNFKGVARRMERIRQDSFLTVYDDFAHHPTAIAATVETIARSHSDQRIWVLLEPRSNTMVRSLITEDLIRGLKLADVIVIGKIHRAASLPVELRLDRKFVAEKLTSLGKQVRVCDQIEEMMEYLKGNLSRGDVIIIMSNGNFDGLRQKLIELTI